MLFAEYEQSPADTHGSLHQKKCEDVLNYQVSFTNYLE